MKSKTSNGRHSKRGRQGYSPSTSSNGSESDVGYRTNTARLKMNGERRAVEILLETPIRDERRLRVLIAETLRAASNAEFDVRCMDDTAVTKRIQELDKTSHAVKWTPNGGSEPPLAARKGNE